MQGSWVVRDVGVKCLLQRVTVMIRALGFYMGFSIGLYIDNFSMNVSLWLKISSSLRASGLQFEGHYCGPDSTGQPAGVTESRPRHQSHKQYLSYDALKREGPDRSQQLQNMKPRCSDFGLIY